jgi:hypothetical protein
MGRSAPRLPWEEQQAEIIKFWTDLGDSWGFPFHNLIGTHYNPREGRLLIVWALGTVAVTGPKALEFYDQIWNHRATLIKRDGKDILSVKMHLNSERQADKDAETVAAEIEGEDLSL